VRDTGRCTGGANAIIALQYTGKSGIVGGNSLADWIVVVFRNPHHSTRITSEGDSNFSGCQSSRRWHRRLPRHHIAADAMFLGAFVLLLLPSSEPGLLARRFNLYWY